MVISMKDPINVINLLNNAASKRNDGFMFTLSGGDLHTMSVHATYLQKQGFEIGFVDVYPSLKTIEEKKRALQMIYDSHIEGWWCYKRDLIEMGICTDKEFNARLGKEA